MHFICVISLTTFKKCDMILIGDFMQNLMNQEKHYITLNNYLRNRFKKKVYKISLNGDFTCPNRDGKISTKGCIFCSADGSGDFAGKRSDSFQDQFSQIKTKMWEKWRDGYYIAYLQANTNTYSELTELRRKYYEIINLDPNIKIFSIATRPDCISDEIIALLTEINQKVEVWVELGFQTSNEATAKFINRGYQNRVFEETVKKLAEVKITTIIHIINGLPTDSKEDMLTTCRYLSKLPIQGIKIHMLHVMKNTPLGDEYQQKPFKLLTLEEYVEIVSLQLSYLNSQIVIHRLTGDAPKDLLLAPDWTLKKFIVLNEIDKYMRKNNIYQGDNYNL